MATAHRYARSEWGTVGLDIEDRCALPLMVPARRAENYAAATGAEHSGAGATLSLPSQRGLQSADFGTRRSFATFGTASNIPIAVSIESDAALARADQRSCTKIAQPFTEPDTPICRRATSRMP